MGMAGYWAAVHKRAWQDTAKSLRLESREAIVIAILTQTLIGVGLWYALGNTALQSTAWGRLLTAAAPFLLFPVIYIYKFAATPSRLAEEARQRGESTREELALQLSRFQNELVRLTIKESFIHKIDPIHIHFHVELLNPGPPSIIRDWRLFIEIEGKSIEVAEPQVRLGRNNPHSTTQQYWLEDDLTTNPLPQGGSIQGGVWYKLPVSVRTMVYTERIMLRLTAVDARGRVISAEYDRNPRLA